MSTFSKAQHANSKSWNADKGSEHGRKKREARGLFDHSQQCPRFICVNEANMFFESDTASDQITYDLLIALINAGFKGLVPKARGVSRERRPDRVGLLTRHAFVKSRSWGTTFGVFQCCFGASDDNVDPEYLKPMSACLARTGPYC